MCATLPTCKHKACCSRAPSQWLSRAGEWSVWNSILVLKALELNELSKTALMPSVTNLLTSSAAISIFISMWLCVLFLFCFVCSSFWDRVKNRSSHPLVHCLNARNCQGRAGPEQGTWNSTSNFMIKVCDSSECFYQKKTQQHLCASKCLVSTWYLRVDMTKKA